MVKFICYSIISFIMLGCANRREDCSYTFAYAFYGKKIKFPLSVDEAVSNYGLVKNKYNVLHDSIKPGHANMSIYYTRGYNYARYSPRTSVATQQFYNTDIYAINFHLRDSGFTVDRIISKLQDDFKSKFIEKSTQMDRIGNYYEMPVNDCISIIVYNDNIFNSLFGVNTINVVFTYKLISPELKTFLETNGNLRAD